nr:unnamed protein product [Callosobruchus chinensis]
MVEFNASKTKYCTLSNKKCPSAGKQLECVSIARNYFSQFNLLLPYKAQIRPSLEYCSHIWGAVDPTTLAILDAVQKRAIRLIADPALTCHVQPLPHRRAVGGPEDRASSPCSGVELFSDDSDGNLSCDSLNHSSSGKSSPITIATITTKSTTTTEVSRFMPQTLLRDIRDRGTTKLSIPTKIDEKSYEERLQDEESKRRSQEPIVDTYQFHLNEKADITESNRLDAIVEDETFAGYKDLLGMGSDGTSTIRSAKGTVRGVKNRVRAGIATFLQINNAPGGKVSCTYFFG